MNQISTLFGASHEKWVSSLRDAVAKRQARLRVVRAMLVTSRRIRSDDGTRRQRVVLLKRLRRSLRARARALGDGGLDPKLAKHILSTVENR